jgi:hypothetical protein
LVYLRFKLGELGLKLGARGGRIGTGRRYRAARVTGRLIEKRRRSGGSEHEKNHRRSDNRNAQNSRKWDADDPLARQINARRERPE